MAGWGCHDVQLISPSHDFLSVRVSSDAAALNSNNHNSTLCLLLAGLWDCSIWLMCTICRPVKMPVHPQLPRSQRQTRSLSAVLVRMPLTVIYTAVGLSILASPAKHYSLKTCFITKAWWVSVNEIAPPMWCIILYLKYLANGMLKQTRNPSFSLVCCCSTQWWFLL